MFFVIFGLWNNFQHFEKSFPQGKSTSFLTLGQQNTSWENFAV